MLTEREHMLELFTKVNSVLTEDETNDFLSGVVRKYELIRMNGTMEIVKKIYGSEFVQPYYEEKERKFYDCGYPFSTQLDDWRLRNLGKVLMGNFK